MWITNRDNKVKLEIGSSVRPDPYSKKNFKSYIHEFLENHNGEDDIKKFELESVELNVLNIERTFVDKLMSVKRHAICGTLGTKVRHIYDVTRLYELPDIQEFLKNTDELKYLIKLTKDTDSYYLGKRNIGKEYDPTKAYDFAEWKDYFTPKIKNVYENLHKELLYTDEKQDFEDVLRVFNEIDIRLRQIGE